MKKKKKGKIKKLNKFASLFDYKCFFYDFVKVTGIVPPLIYYRQKTIFASKESKKEFKKTPCLIVSNHSSFFDCMILLLAFYYKRIGLVATKELFNTKFKNFLFKGFGCICVDKENVSVKTFKDVKERIYRGHSVGVFPEGTVFHESKEMDEFKAGVIMMSLMSEAPIYPVYILKRKHWYHRQKIYVGEKFDVKEYLNTSMPTLEQINECSSKLQSMVEHLKELAKE